MREPVRSHGRRGVLAMAAGAVAALALAVPAAQAADTCPNAAVRAAQNGTRLPECRAYEQISAQFKNGNLIGGHLPAVSPDGGGLLYQSYSTFGDALSNLASRTVARRGTDGWRSTSMVPPFTSRVPVVADIPSVVAVSPSLDSVIYGTRYPLSPDDRGTSLAGGALTNHDLYQYDADGSLTWLSRMPVLPDSSELNVDFTMASADTSRVVVRTQRALDPAFPDLTTPQFYLIVDKQQARLLSVLPDGTASAGVDNGNAASTWGDEDFSRIVFAPPAELAPSGVSTLYLRDHADNPALAQTRELTFGPADAPCGGPVSRLTADGRRMLVSCTGGAYPDPTAGQQSLYVADVDTGDVTRLPVAGNVVASSEDLSRIYIASSDKALPGAGDTNLYLVRNGELSLVATDPELVFDSRLFSPAVLSADGDQIAFASALALGFPSGGLAQIYRYDATVGAASLNCISCRPDGATATESGSISPLSLTGDAVAGTMSSDGRRVFFTTASRLVPDDTNGVLDAYLWLDGELHLISSGRSPSNSYAAGASADGAELYFTTLESLVPQDIDNGVGDLYAATVGGGFAAGGDEAPCTTDCQGPAKGLEALPAPGTVSFSGPGDVGDGEDGSQSTVVKVFRVEGVGPKVRATWARGGRAAVRVRLSHAGRATAVMRARIGKRSVVIARASRSAAGGGTVSLPLRLSKSARAVLGREGVLRASVRVTVPGAGGAQSASFVLRTEKAKRGRR